MLVQILRRKLENYTWGPLILAAFWPQDYNRHTGYNWVGPVPTWHRSQASA